MNIFFKSYKFYLFFLLLCAAKVPLLLGHIPQLDYTLVPEILRFDLPTKFNRSQNTSLCRNDNGIVFIGKQNGVLGVDDNRFFLTPTKSPVYLCRSDKDKTIYLTEDDFGIVDFNPLKGPLLNSLITKAPENIRSFIPQSLTNLKAHTFMATSEGIFVLGEDSFSHFSYNSSAYNLFNTGIHLFLLAEGKGLYLWTGTEFEIVLDPDNLSSIQLTDIIEKGEDIYILDDHSNSYLLNLNDGTLTISYDEFLDSHSLNFSHRLYDDLYLCSCSRNELILTSLKDSTFNPITKSGVLPKSQLQSVFVDAFKDIWLIYDYNIFKVEYPSRTYTLDLNELISGTILSTAVNENSILLASNEGLFLLSNNHTESFTPKLISTQEHGQIRLLSSYNNKVIAGGNRGLFSIDDEKINQIDAGDFSCINYINNTTILASGKSGLFCYNYEGETWKRFLLDKDISQIVSVISINDEIWISTDSPKILKIQNKQTIAYSIDDNPLDGVYRLLLFRNKILVLGGRSTYVWNAAEDEFLPFQNTDIINQFTNSDLIQNTDNHIWTSESDILGTYTIWRIDHDHTHIPYYEIQPDKQFGQIIDIDEGLDFIWISGNKKLLRLQKTMPDSSNKNFLKIQALELSSKNELADPVLISENQILKYKKNRMIFKLSSLRYLKKPDLFYRYKLSHYQEDWSDWSRQKNIEFENLIERNYIFQAQAVSSMGIVSDTAILSFRISPPVYRKWYAYLFYFMLFLSTAFLMYKWRLLSLKKVEFKLEKRINEKLASVLHEKEKSDKLVADLFPKGTAEELKNSGRAKSKKFEMATVLFSDIQGFTKIAEEMNPEELIDELDKFFFHFDSVVEKYNIEKIKTIGDAYMAAGGIPVKNSSNPVEVVLAGLEMQHYMNDLKRKKTDIWDLRIGIHTGPVISGVVGHKKLSYDIWGDTVNTASRMESSGEGGKVNISGTTFSLVKEYFICEYRGKLPVKYKGNIDMYFVTGLRPELSVNLQGIPNRRFFIKLQLLKLKDVEARVLDEILKDHLLDLHFHTREYIQKVYNQTELLSRSENITDDELLLTQTAALLLFSGLSESYENFENKSVEITRTILPEYGYDDKQIDRICNLILAAKEPFNPKNILEEIMIDARFEYLGRSDYSTQIKLLFLELKAMNKEQSKEKIIRKQTSLLKDFKYFTLAAQRLREVDSEMQIENLRSW